MSSGHADEIAERLQRNVGRVLRAARWMLAPLYIGLLLSLLLLLFKFAQVLIAAVAALPGMSSSETIVKVLTLTDLALVANLVVIVILAGWRNVTRPLRHGEGAAGSASLDFGEVKLTIIASAAAIAAIQLLETFVYIAEVPASQAMWQLAILLGISATGVMLALMDRLARHG